MQISHLGHAAVLLQTPGATVLIDPGNVDARWTDLTGLDAVLVTHVHPDHLDPEQVPTLLAANPDAARYAEPSVAANPPEGVEGLQPLTVGEQLTIGDLTVDVVGGRHAVIHADLPSIGNVGLVFSAPGQPTFFHPGDAYDTVPTGVDVLAVPAYGPWAAMKETIDFVRAVAAPRGFLIHDGLLNERGRTLISGRVDAMTPTTLDDLRDREPTDY